MKRLLSLLLSFYLAVPVFSQNTLTIHQKDGQQFSFGFEDKPVITYTDNALVLKTVKTEVQYPLASLAKFTFTESETAVTPVSADKNNPVLSLDSYVVNISGAKADVSVSVIGSDGKILSTYQTDSDGGVTFSIADLPQGTYIIKSENLTC